MLKLKIATASLALAGLVLLLMGSTYLTTSLAVLCTAIALFLALHLTFRYFMRLMEYWSEGWLWFSSVWLSIISAFTAVSVLQDIGVVNMPLSATIENAQKMGDVGQYVSIANIISILLSVGVPRRSPTRDNSDDDNKG